MEVQRSDDEIIKTCELQKTQRLSGAPDLFFPSRGEKLIVDNKDRKQLFTG